MFTVRRWTILAVAAAALLLLAVFLTSSANETGGSAGPQGTLALERLLRERGVAVHDADRPPEAGGTFVVLLDLRDEPADAGLIDWAGRTGGTLVIADPASGVATALGVGRAGRIGGFVGSTALEPGCIGPEAVGVERLVVSVSDAALASERPGALRCFAGGSGSFELSIPNGPGRVVLVGGDSPLTNQFLHQGDDAAFALALVSGGPGPVVFGPAIGPGTAASGSVWHVLPAAGRFAVVGAILVAVAFAVSRARRLGRPVEERPLSPIPAGELVRAKADLYRVAGDRGHAARLLRTALLARLGRRAGVPPGADARQVVAVAETEPAARARLERSLSAGDPTNDDALIALGRELEEEAGHAGTGGRW